MSSSENSVLPHLVGARYSRLPQSELGLVVPWKTNAERAWVRCHREETFRCMHLVASALKDHGQEQEAVLCSLRFYSESGLLCATPGFSVPIDVDTDPDAFTKGPKLSTYTVAVAGAQYEYTLDNVNDLMPLVSPSDQQLVRELRLLEEKQDAVQVSKYNTHMDPSGSGDLTEDEQMRTNGVLKRTLVLVEVVSVLDLAATDPVFVQVNLRFPDRYHHHPRWKLRSASIPPKQAKQQRTQQSSIRTPLSTPACVSQGTSVAAFGFHTQFDLELRKPKETPDDGKAAGIAADDDQERDERRLHAAASPILSFGVYSRDSWGRTRAEGGGELTIPPSTGHRDLDIPISKSILSVREELEEFFLGMDEHETAMSQYVSSSDTTLHSVNSRLGMQVQSTGASLRVRLNIVEQTPRRRPAAAARRQHAAAGIPTAAHSSLTHPSASGLRVVKRSVNEILQSVKLEKRVSQSTDPSLQSALGSMSTGGASAVNSMLARLNAAKTSAGIH